MNNIITQLDTLLNGNLNADYGIVTYYKGEVVLPAKSYMPCVMIIPVSTSVVAKSTAKDQFEHVVTIRVVHDIKKFFKEAGTGTTIAATAELANIMEERESNGTLKSDTILGILRANIKTDDFLFNNDITIEYAVIQQGEFFYTQAEMELTATTDLLTRP